LLGRVSEFKDLAGSDRKMADPYAFAPLMAEQIIKGMEITALPPSLVLCMSLH
jgi:hypothetical protein